MMGLLQHSATSDDDGFPILRRDVNDEGMRMVGYIGVNELEHALSLSNFVDSAKCYI
jgi:chloride channel 3/4/5